MPLVSWIERHLPEPLRDREIARALQDIRRRAANPDLRSDLIWRIQRLAPNAAVALDSRPRLRAFSDVFKVFNWQSFRLRINLAAVGDDQGEVIAFDGVLRLRRQRAARLVRTVRVGQRFVVHDLFAIEPEFRGRGLAPAILKSSFDYYDRIGIQVVVVHAALETGRHYWARCGFDFLPGERAKVDAWFNEVLQGLGIVFDTSSFTHANDYTTLSGLVSPEKVSLEEIAACTTMPRDHVVEVAEKNGLTMDEKIDLARAIMLTGPDWEGILRLDPAGHDRRVFENFFQLRVQSLQT